MLLSIQIPLTDARTFLANTGRLKKASWLIPDPERDFVRNFGMIRFRRKGGLDGWIGENEICEANRVIQFPHGIGKYWWGSSGRTYPRCAFRRLYFDGLVTGKFEIGIRQPELPDLAGKFIEHCVSIPTRMAMSGREQELIQAGPRLAAAYRVATTEHGHYIGPEWWVTASHPILFLECRAPWADVSIPVRPVLRRDQFSLSWGFYVHRGIQYRLWLLNVDPSYRPGAAQDAARGLRIALLRLNAAHESLRTILRHIDDGKILGTHDNVQDYLNKATSRILDLEQHTDEQGNENVTALARAAMDTITAPEKESLRRCLEHIRLNVKRKVDEYAGKDTGNPPSVQNIYNFAGYQGEVTVGSKFDNRGAQIGIVGDHATGNKLTLEQTVQQTQYGFDLEMLCAELTRLRAELEKLPHGPDREIAVHALAAAQEEAGKDNKAKALEYMGKAGKIALDLATKIGADVVAAALKTSMGLS